jgi:GNAT superfamily N-acetyltransferase
VGSSPTVGTIFLFIERVLLIMIDSVKIVLNPRLRIEDFNSVAKKPELLKKLRNLTLHRTSGMNHELNELLLLVKDRTVNCKIMTAYKGRKLVGWALLSKEESDFYFPCHDGYQPHWGALFEVFVDREHRRQGIATAMLKRAKKECGEEKICICPHDYTSREFFANFKTLKTKSL